MAWVGVLDFTWKQVQCATAFSLRTMVVKECLFGHGINQVTINPWTKLYF